MQKSSIIKAAGLVSALGALVGAVLTVDGRYAHAESLRSYKGELAQALEDQRQSSERQVLQLRRQMIEDKMFEIDARVGSAARSPAEDAVYKRYARELEYLSRELSRPVKPR